MGYTVAKNKFSVKDSGGRVGGKGRIPLNAGIQHQGSVVKTVKRGGGAMRTAKNTAGR